MFFQSFLALFCAWQDASLFFTTGVYDDTLALWLQLKSEELIIQLALPHSFMAHKIIAKKCLMMMIMMMNNFWLLMMMMNCFCGIVDRRKALYLISSPDHWIYYWITLMNNKYQLINVLRLELGLLSSIKFESLWNQKQHFDVLRNLFNNKISKFELVIRNVIWLFLTIQLWICCSKNR